MSFGIICPSMKALCIKSFWLVLFAFIDAHCLHLCSLPSLVLIALFGAHCLHWCSLPSFVLIAFIGAYCLHWCSLPSLVLIAFIGANCHHYCTHQWRNAHEANILGTFWNCAQMKNAPMKNARTKDLMYICIPSSAATIFDDTNVIPYTPMWRFAYLCILVE